MADLDSRFGESMGLPKVLREIANDVLHGRSHGDGDGVVIGLRSPLTFIHRTRESLREKSPQLKDGVRHTSSEIVQWMHKGGPWRAFLVSTVGIVLLLALVGLCTFLLFFLAATVNAVAIGFLASVASVGAFMALFFTSLTTIYIGFLIMAVLSISIITFFCIWVALIVAGWIAFIWVLWQGLKKGIDIFNTSFLMSVGNLMMVRSGGSRPYKKMHH